MSLSKLADVEQALVFAYGLNVTAALFGVTLLVFHAEMQERFGRIPAEFQTVGCFHGETMGEFHNDQGQ